MKQFQRDHLRCTEADLTAEIHRIGGLLARATGGRDERSRCAASYLHQLLRDREDTLATVRARQREVV